MSAPLSWSWIVSHIRSIPHDTYSNFTLARMRILISKGSARAVLLSLVSISLLLFFFNPHYQRQASTLGTPIPQVSPKLARKLEDLHTSLGAHYEKHGQRVPNGIFPYPALTAAQMKRYDHLRKGDEDKGLYMFTTITRQISDQLPDLLSALLVVLDFLGPNRVAFSFLEGPSTDLTPSVLDDILHPLLTSLGVSENRIHITTHSPAIDFSDPTSNRIAILASLRNTALSPLWDSNSELKDVTKAVVFMNDVYLKAEHLLEVMHMHEVNGADLSSGWDWYRKDPAYYYDVWVGRTVSPPSVHERSSSRSTSLLQRLISHKLLLLQIDKGDLFYPIDHSWWTPSEDLFPNSPLSSESYTSLNPFQVFSTWNGLAIMNPAPFLPPRDVRFRRSDLEKEECAASECTLVCGDFWKEGFGKIQVVPSVQVSAHGMSVCRRDPFLTHHTTSSWRTRGM